MRKQAEVMVKTLLAVAWADGRLHCTEEAVFAAIATALSLAPEALDAIRTADERPQGLAALDFGALDSDERRVLLQHAIIMTHVDGHESAEESAVLRELASALGVDNAEAAAMFTAARTRAKRLRHLKS